MQLHCAVKYEVENNYNCNTCCVHLIYGSIVTAGYRQRLPLRFVDHGREDVFCRPSRNFILVESTTGRVAERLDARSGASFKVEEGGRHKHAHHSAAKVSVQTYGNE